MKFTGKLNSALLKIQDTLHKHLSFYDYKKYLSKCYSLFEFQKPAKAYLKVRFISYIFSNKIAISVIEDSTQIQLEKFQVKYL